MKKQIYKSLLFSIPIFLFISYITIVDPYEFINLVHIISADKKLKVLNRNDESGPRGNLLWKLVHYKRNPVENVLFGDSQCRAIEESQLDSLTGEDWFNFCIPGASYETIFDNFWFCAEKVKLKKVYMEVSFMNYNGFRSYNISNLGTDYMDKPYLYFARKEILFDSWINMRYAISGNQYLVINSHELAPAYEMDILANERMDLFLKVMNILIPYSPV